MFIKLLEEDCLLGEKLHPAIAERLARVRELPEKCVANLHGVERDARCGVACLVWDWIEGEPIIEYAKRAEVTHDEVQRLARELVLAVQSLHLAGIVHGALAEGNVIVGARGEVWLTDFSPLLWDDEQEDVVAVNALLNKMVEQAGPEELEHELLKLDCSRITLAGLLEVLRGNAQEQPEALERLQRWKPVLAAALALALGAGVAVGIKRAVTPEGKDAVSATRSAGL